MSKGIKLTSEQIQFLYKNSDYDGGFRSGGEILEGFERWWIQADEDTGEYDTSYSFLVYEGYKLK